MCPTKLNQEKIKVYSQNAWPWEMSRMFNTSGKIAIKDFARIRFPIAYTHPALPPIEGQFNSALQSFV